MNSRNVPQPVCDCHTHIFVPGASTPFAPAYPLPNAPYAVHRAMLDTISASRAVLIQPSAYGPDHRVMADAIAKSKGNLVGVGLLQAGATAADFDRLENCGVRALRFVEARVPGTGERYPGNSSIDDFVALRSAMAARGWHAEIWAPLAQAAEICDAMANDDVPIVLDHLAGADVLTDVDDPAFVRILHHLTTGRIWVKLVLCRTAETLEQALATRMLHDALLAANPDRLIWGTDFPFIRKENFAPDPARLLQILRDWAGSHADRILAGNPAELYRFN